MLSNLFIAGPPRSGTTLLRLILNEHKSIYITPESSYFYRYTKLFERIINGSKHNLTFFLDILNYIPSVSHWSKNINKKKFIDKNFSNDSFVNIINQLIIDVSKKENLLYVGDKTPKNIYIIDELISKFINTKVILIIRNPYDTIYSQIKSGFTNHNIFSLVHRWNYEANLIINLKSNYPNNIFVIKYEELVNNTEQSIERVLIFLGLNIDKKILEKYSNNDYDDVDHVKSFLYKKKISTNRIYYRKPNFFFEESLISKLIDIKPIKFFGYKILKTNNKIFFLKRLRYFFTLKNHFNKYQLRNIFSFTFIFLKIFIFKLNIFKFLKK
ncbi:sulfotransferase family protein [Candidatus Pelagibacter sp.]|uniref:sulfotransferase family protein n=1 Tax=Candidatus Pelagibacter sp. TaxID=2024849 RepID=UPI003D097148